MELKLTMPIKIRKFWKSFLYKTILGVAVIEVAFLSLLISIVISGVEQFTLEMMQKRANSTAYIVAQMVKDPLVSFDLARLESIAAEVLQAEDVSYLNIYDVEGQLMFGDPAMPHAVSDELIEGSYFTATIISVAGEEFGSLRMGFSVTWVAQFISAIRHQALLIVALEVIAVALVAATFGLWLTRGFRALVKAADQLTSGNISKPINIRADDEILQVSGALERLRTELLAKGEALKLKRQTQSRIYGVLAHELRTPVAAIDMLARQSPEEWSESRETIKEVTQDLLHTIDDMRMLVNPNLKRELNYENTSVERINSAISAMVASTVATTGILYNQMTVLPVAMEHEVFSTDAYRIKAAVTNLVRNACLHSEGTKVVLVTALSIDQLGNRAIKWVVRDDGKGIPEAKIAELFEPFSRGDSKAEGTGLGMHIAKTWLEEVGGSLTYRRLDRGSEFAVFVPLKYEANDSSTDTSFEAAKSIARNMRVLLVEDDKVLQMVTRKMLTNLFALVDVANDGQEGLSEAHSEYDLILTDYFMPNMTGVEMIKQLREGGVTIPIVGATAATMAGQDEEMLSAGADAVLLKPLNSEMVLQMIAELKQRGRLNLGGASDES